MKLLQLGVFSWHWLMMASSVITCEAMFHLLSTYIDCHACQFQLNKSIVVPRWHSKASRGRCRWHLISPWADHLSTCSIVSLSCCDLCPPWSITTKLRCSIQILWPRHVFLLPPRLGQIWQSRIYCNTEFLSQGDIWSSFRLRCSKMLSCSKGLPSICTQVVCVSRILKRKGYKSK